MASLVALVSAAYPTLVLFLGQMKSCPSRQARFGAANNSSRFHPARRCSTIAAACAFFGIVSGVESEDGADETEYATARTEN